MNRIQHAFGDMQDALLALGNEVTSVWVLTQVVLILLAAAIGTVAATLLRRRVDVSAHTIGWPPILRLWVQLFMANLGTIFFVLLVVSARGALIGMTLPSRSYLLDIAASLATAWVVIALVAGLIRNQFVYRLVAAFAWTIAALNILGLREPVRSALDSIRGGDRRLARIAAAGD